MYEIAYDASANMLRLRLTGFWTPSVVEAFADEFLATVRRLARTAPDLVIISDCRDYPVQSSEVTAAYADRLGPSAGMRQPFAMVVGGMLSKLQADRVADGANFGTFTTLEAAQRWLEEVRPARTSSGRSAA